MIMSAIVHIHLVSNFPDSLEMVLSRQNAIKSLLDAMKTFPEKSELLFEACNSLLKQVQHSGKSVHQHWINTTINVTVHTSVSRAWTRSCATINIKCWNGWYVIKTPFYFPEASLHYLSMNEGIERLHTIMKTFQENKELLAVVLDIFGYYSFQGNALFVGYTIKLSHTAYT